MTVTEFWAAVGEHLMVTRTRRGLNPIDVQRAGGPHYATVQAIELGKIGRIDKLRQHAEALNINLVDLFRMVLKVEDVPLSPEAAQILRKYESTNLDGRRALVAMAEALPTERHATPGGSPDAE